MAHCFTISVFKESVRHELTTDLLDTCDICFIQEHWLFTEHLSDLNSVNEFTSVGVSGMDSGILLCGRPYGGCGILYCKSLSPYVKTLHTGSNRLCSITV